MKAAIAKVRKVIAWRSAMTPASTIAIMMKLRWVETLAPDINR